MRDISSIIQKNAKLFLEPIKQISDISRIHCTISKNGGFPVFMIDNKEFYEQSYFDQRVENSIWRYLVNAVFNDLFTTEYCESNNVRFEWQWVHPQLAFSYVEVIEDKYRPVEFIITRNGVREGYRYTNCYMNEERFRKLFDSKHIDKLYVIDFSSDTQSSFMHPLVAPGAFKGLIHKISLKDFFCQFFTEDEYSVYLSKASEVVKEAYQYVGKQTITNLTFQSLPYFLQTILHEISSFPYAAKSYVPNSALKEPALSWYDNGILSNCDQETIRLNFHNLKRYYSLTGNKDFAKSFITSEYLYQTLKDNSRFDFTAIVTGYFKSIEQLLYLLLEIVENDGHLVDVWIQSKKPFCKVPKNRKAEFRLNPNDQSRTQVKVNSSNQKYYDTSFAALVYMLHDYSSCWAVSPHAKDVISALLLTYSDECRNEHFHKDNIYDIKEVEIIRDKTYLLIYYVLGGYDFSKSGQSERSLLGIIDNSFEMLYRRIMEYGPGNYYYLHFDSEIPAFVALPMQQESPNYDNNGLITNASLRFVKTGRKSIENWRMDNWGQIEAELSDDKTVIVTRNNMPSSVTYVDKITGQTTDIKW